jgi:hypothetical protein
MTQMRQQNTSKPYEMLGAGQLVSAVWKFGDERAGWAYRFNIYRMSQRNGRVSQLFRPTDVQDLVKLCQVMAVTLSDDGCVPIEQRRLLAALAAELDTITSKRN